MTRYLLLMDFGLRLVREVRFKGEGLMDYGIGFQLGIRGQIFKSAGLTSSCVLMDFGTEFGVSIRY